MAVSVPPTRGGRRESDGHEHHAEPDEPVAMVPRNVVRSWRVAYVEDEALRGASVTAPVDPVEALARVVFEAGERAKYPGDESRWDDWKDGQDGDTARAQARAALAHARGLVPEVNTDWHEHEAYLRGWSACRAETLRRLGGD